MTRIPPFAATGDALDLTRWQAQRLAQLPNGAARAIRREGSDQRRAIPAITLVDARNQLLPDISRKVEVDVRQGGEFLIEETPDHQRVLNRVDMRQTGEVTDD